MASFGKPISRKNADRLVAGLVDRAREYNSYDSKPLLVHRSKFSAATYKKTSTPWEMSTSNLASADGSPANAVRGYTKASVAVHVLRRSVTAHRLRTTRDQVSLW